MNKKKMISIVAVICGVLILLSLTTFAGPCPVEVGEKPMKCYWTAQAMKGLAVVMILSGIGKLLFKSEDMIRGIAFTDILISLFGLALLTFLIGTCGNPQMHCNLLMKPITLLLTGVYGVIGIINFMINKDRHRERRN